MADTSTKRRIDPLEEMRRELARNQQAPSLDAAKQNAMGAWDVIKQVPNNLYRLATDPVNYIKSLPAPTGEQIMNAYGPGNIGGGFAGIMIGPKARTYSIERALKAEEMLKAGKSPQEVWKETGTLIGPDGIPRQEISDQAAKFRRPDELDELKNTFQMMVDEAKKKIAPDRTGQKDLFPKELTAAKRPVRENIKAMQSDIRELNRSPRTQGVAAEWTLDHPELYSAYPELARIPVTQTPILGAEKGSLTYAGNRFDDLNIRDVRDPRSVALHEMQHAVQAIEGMSPGANPTSAFNYPEAHAILEAKRKAAATPMPFKEYAKQGGYDVQDYPDLARARRDYVDYASDVPSIAKKYDQEFQRNAAMEWYKRQHGEAEARATQARRDMGNAERREVFPYESYDIKPEEFLTREPVPFGEVTGKAEGGSAMPQDVKAKLDQLKQEFTQLAERDRRAAQAAWNAEQMANKKAKGGSTLEFERGEHGYEEGVPRSSEGEAGYGIYAYPKNNNAMRKYYTSRGENVVSIVPHEDASILDFTNREHAQRALEEAKRISPSGKTSATLATIHKHPWALKAVAQQHGAHGYIVHHRGEGIPTGKQLIITDDTKFNYAKKPSANKAKGGNVSTDGMRYALTMKRGKKHG